MHLLRHFVNPSDPPCDCEYCVNFRNNMGHDYACKRVADAPQRSNMNAPLFPSKRPYVVTVFGAEINRFPTFEEALEHAKILVTEPPAAIDIHNENELDLDDDGLTQAEREALREEL